jgi:hypothetical protein
MQSALLRNKLTVKFSDIFIQHINHEKYIKQLLLESRSFYTEQLLQGLVLKIFLSVPSSVWSLL